MNRTITIAVVAAAAALIAGVVAFAVMRGDDHMRDTTGNHAMGRTMGGSGPLWGGDMMQMGDMPGMSMSPGGAMAMSDQAFLAMMIPHHQMAVDMANVAVKRGKDPETVALARQVIADQTAEMGEMYTWYRDWFGSEPPRMPMSGAMAMMGMSMDMDELRTTREPDRAFLRMMIPHHAGALLMADSVLNGKPPAQVDRLAREIVAAQSTEIGAMQKMRQRLAPPLG
jgi:uncharacterized protein (DUF305 family)